jgi:hypothetical protein
MSVRDHVVLPYQCGASVGAHIRSPSALGEMTVLKSD